MHHADGQETCEQNPDQKIEALRQRPEAEADSLHAGSLAGAT